MKRVLNIATTLLLAAGLSACDGIGDGNTIVKLEVVDGLVAPFEQGVRLDAGTAAERFHMYDCFCSSLVVLATFTDGTVANFSNRVTFTSSDPAVVSVLNFADEPAVECPADQQVAGLLTPKGLGTATITARFASLTAQTTVEVADASQDADGTPAGYVLRAAPPAGAGASAVAVGASLPLQLLATLDGRERDVTANVTTWSFDNADDAIATISTGGIVSGVAGSAGAPRVARATFGSCADVSPTLALDVGHMVEPLTLDREAPDFATDGMLAEQSDEFPTVTAPLDFDGDGTPDGLQLLTGLADLDYTDSCTLREYDASVPTTFCRETTTTCTSTVPGCTSSSATTCDAGMTACRTETSPLVAVSGGRIVALVDRGTATNVFATFPDDRGDPTALAAAVTDGTTTTIAVDALTGYPLAPPWYGVIDKAGAREDVRVTAVDGDTLTVERGVGGTAAVAHAAGDGFEQRSYASDPNAPLMIRAKEGTLTRVDIEAPGVLVGGGRLQLSAQGIFVDTAAASRQQRVTRLNEPTVGAPQTDWLSSDTTVASFFFPEDRGLLLSSFCGGRVTVRVRSNLSTDATTETFDPATAADDDACENTDPLCDQVEICIATPVPAPLGAACSTVTTCP